MAFPEEGRQYDNRIYRNGVYRYTSELSVGELTVTGSVTLGVEKTLNVNVGTATITVPALELGEMKVIRKISSSVGTITITLPTGHTFSGGGQSITLENRYEEVTIERVSSTVWVEKDRVEVFVITDYLNGFEQFSVYTAMLAKKNNVVYMRGLVRGGNATAQLPIFQLPTQFRPTTIQNIVVSTSGRISGAIVPEVLLVAVDFKVLKATTNNYIGASDYINLNSVWRTDV